jgi:membrane protease YdiL (CAAX protease family)
VPALTRNEYDILVVTLSWIVGFIPLFVQRLRGRHGPTWIQCMGLALVATAFVRMLVGIYLSIGALFVFTVLEPVSREALWRSVGRDILFDLAIPITGILLLHNAVPGLQSRQTRPSTVHAALDAEGLGPKSSYTRDALRGFTLFFCIAIAYMVALAVSVLFTPVQVGGDESHYWRNITIPLIVLVSGMSGLTEELLFRGILFTRLARAMPLIVAVLLQAIFFGVIHAGYGTWTHVIAPALFGLGMAWIVRTLGLVPAILLHAQINIVFFAFEISDVVPQAWWFLVLLAIVNLVAAFVTRLDAVSLLWASLDAGVRRAAGFLGSRARPQK